MLQGPWVQRYPQSFACGGAPVTLGAEIPQKFCTHRLSRDPGCETPQMFWVRRPSTGPTKGDAPRCWVWRLQWSCSWRLSKGPWCRDTPSCGCRDNPKILDARTPLRHIWTPQTLWVQGCPKGPKEKDPPKVLGAEMSHLTTTARQEQVPLTRCLYGGLLEPPNLCPPHFLVG